MIVKMNIMHNKNALYTHLRRGGGSGFTSFPCKVYDVISIQHEGIQTQILVVNTCDTPIKDGKVAYRMGGS